MQSQKILWLTEKKTVVLQTEKSCLKYRNSDRKRSSSAQVLCVFPKVRIHLMLQVFIRRSYAAAEKLLKKQGYEADAITAHQLTGLGLTIGDYKKLAEELGIGEITLRDIVKELEKPARDPRDEMPKPILRTDVLEMKDLKEGMVLKGTVRNVIDFGVFVDIGVHQDGLVHISQITRQIYQTSAGGSKCWRHCGCEGDECGSEEEEDPADDERNLIILHIVLLK